MLVYPDSPVGASDSCHVMPSYEYNNVFSPCIVPDATNLSFPQDMILPMCMISEFNTATSHSLRNDRFHRELTNSPV